MPDLIEIKDVDREFYARHLRDFLPHRIIDVHAHVWQGDRPSVSDPATAARVVSWPSRVAAANPIEDLSETYRLMLPDKLVTPLIFASPTLGSEVDGQNAYIEQCRHRCSVPTLMLSLPEWPADVLESKIAAGGFIGIKPYLSFAPAYLPPGEIRIYDFLPPHQLEVIDRHGWIAMLHVPRPARLRDPVNVAQMLEMDRRFPNAGVIIAHVGRAYCPEDVGDAFEQLAPAANLVFDISANTNEYVFRRLLDAVGPRRVLFGSDMPILRMRMRRTCEGGRYVNIVPRGLYGDVSGDPHMREIDGPEADRLTFFLYEEIEAFRRAAMICGLSAIDVECVFYHNASQMIEKAHRG
ncbi:MAG TPA: amidohydrolase family protein [Planctomycetota bacterium]|nr:amidohydrolase family protein [Planctomycetota bacterium]